MLIRLVVLILIPCFTCAQTPAARWLQQAAYDALHNQVLVYSGAGDDTLFADLWAFKNNAWTKLSEGELPGRIKAAFTYDEHRGCAVVFGGSGNRPLLDETWEWNGRHWKQVLLPGPSARNHPMAVYDRKHKVVLVFGGFNNSGLLRDTWTYDGRQWILADSAGPGNGLPHGLVYDEVKEAVILITLSAKRSAADSTRSVNETWEWTGSGWKKLTGSPLSTSAGSLQALAGFGKNGIVLFDGDDRQQQHGRTWLYANGKWKGVYLDGPSARVGHSMVFDKAANRTILFAGGNRKQLFNDCWAWDGSRWKKIL